MRHIPEDELHAYLDQALSRSQCAEIETHLSACQACQARRVSVAALRDRTTALLSRLTPRPLIVPPPYLALREQHGRRIALAVWRLRLRRSGLWAAAIAAAVGSGWIARSVLDPHRPLGVMASLSQAPRADGSTVAADGAATDATAELERQATPAPIPQRPAELLARQATSRTVSQVVPAPMLRLVSAMVPVSYSPAVENPVASRAPSNDPFSRVWRAVPWEDALQIAGSSLPFIEGLTVVGVLLQPGAPGERPMVIVAQQDLNGEIVQSIEGPVAKVDELIQRQSSSDSHASEAARTPPDYVEGPGGMRRALRTLVVTGRLPVDSLNALARMATMR